MNRSRHAILVPLFAVLALLCCLTENASAAFNHAATEPHYGNFLLRESEASEFSAYEIADPIKENGEWIYDSALGVPVYVRQNPWTMFDPLGLWETDSYLGDVGKFYTGMGKAAGGLISGVANSVVDLPKNLATIAVGAYDNATDNNVRAQAGATLSETGSAIKDAASDYGSKVAAGDMETLGDATFQILSIAAPIAATKATVAAEAANASRVAGLTNVVDDATNVAGATARQTSNTTAKVTESTLHTRGVSPAPGTRTLDGYVKQSASQAEIGLYTKSPGFDISSGSTHFKRFGADSHAGLSPHIHQPIRNPTPSGARGTTGTKTKNGGVTKPSSKDVKQLYDHLENGKYKE